MQYVKCDLALISNILFFRKFIERRKKNTLQSLTYNCTYPNHNIKPLEITERSLSGLHNNKSI